MNGKLIQGQKGRSGHNRELNVAARSK